MYKHKNGDVNWNKVLQWVLIALIIGILVTQFNFWAFWWIPFMLFGFGRCWSSCNYHDHDSRKHKTDDINYV